MSYKRSLSDYLPNERHCLYGMDADLVSSVFIFKNVTSVIDKYLLFICVLCILFMLVA